MGARWNWDAICKNGHQYGNFSGGADDCYTCGAEPEVVFNGDDSSEQLAKWKATCRAASPYDDGVVCDKPKDHDELHGGVQHIPARVEWRSVQHQGKEDNLG